MGSDATYGFNYTHPSEPLAHPYVYFSAEQLGSDPEGMVSAAIPSAPRGLAPATFPRSRRLASPRLL